jgi:hypothetical protein
MQARGKLVSVPNCATAVNSTWQISLGRNRMSGHIVAVNMQSPTSDLVARGCKRGGGRQRRLQNELI